MRARWAVAAAAMLCGSAGSAAAQTTVDFDRDVKPLLRDKCVACHGASQQNGGLRLDRRQSAMLGGGTGVAILPGNAARSPLIWRVSGPTSFGPQMPPTGALRSDEIATLARWIDTGAPWPDPPPAAADTPLMRAALSGTAAEMRALIDRRADVNARNGDGVTALMWSVADPEKVRLLVEHGADVRARSDDGRTALHIAAARTGASDIVTLLLGHGASATDPGAGTPPIEIAANAGDAATLDALLQAGATPTEGAAAIAAFNECRPCVDVLRRHGLDAKALGPALGLAIGMDGVAMVDYLLQSGAPLDAAQLPPWSDYTPLMLAAYSDRDSAAKVRLLLAAGADKTATTPTGETAATLAARKGDRAVLDLLTAPTPKPAAEAAAATGRTAASTPDGLRTAAGKSVALLQKADVVFFKNTGCISCHHQTLPAMLVAMAARKGVRVDEEAARASLRTVNAYLDERRQRTLQGFGIPGAPTTAGYLLIALHAQGQPPTPATDALARQLQATQLADGRWRIQAPRPPIESSDVTATAVSLRALRLYAPAADRAAADRAVAGAVAWLGRAAAASTEERTFRLLGLAWGGASRRLVAGAARDLAADQRADGGWAELPGLESDAYSTGQALFALREAGAAAPSDARVQRGIAFLLRTQHDDGSWLVKSRSIPVQVYFETGFPHGADQFVSAAGTAWAALALTQAVP
jgi:ankyrin repeat protein